MNSDDNITKKELKPQDSVSKRHTVLSGNTYVDGKSHRDWFIGHFLENFYGLRATSEVEVKWGVHQAGEERYVWGQSEKATTLCILLRGRVQILFPGKNCILSKEGDYVIWSAGILHRWRMLEDTLILTIRWPSMPEDYKQ